MFYSRNPMGRPRRYNRDDFVDLCKSDLTPTEIAKHTGASISTIVKICRELGIEKGHKKIGRPSLYRKDDFVDLCKSDLTFTEIAKRTGASISTVMNICRELELRKRKRRKRRPKRYNRDDFVDLCKSDLPISEIAKRTGVHATTALRICRELGFEKGYEKKGRPRLYNRDDFIDLCKSDLTPAEIAKRTGASLSTVIKICQELGLKRGHSRPGRPRLYQIADKELVRLCTSDLSYFEMAEQTGIPVNVLRTRCHKLGLRVSFEAQDPSNRVEKILDNEESLESKVTRLCKLGLSYSEISRLTGMSRRKVTTLCKKTGAARKLGRSITPYKKSLIKKLCREGLSYAEIARRVKSSDVHVAKICREAGIDKKGFYNERLVSAIKELCREGLSYSEISRQTGVGRKAVSRICKSI